MVVHRVTGDNSGLFAPMNGLYESFGFETSNGFSSFMSKNKIMSIEHGQLKAHLHIKGVARFIDGDGIRALLECRLEGADLANRIIITESHACN